MYFVGASLRLLIQKNSIRELVADCNNLRDPLEAYG